MNIEGKVALLSRITPFERHGEDVLRRVGSALDLAEVPVGASLAREGAVSRQVFLVVEGTARVSSRGVGLGSVGAGGVIGEVTMFTPGPQSATVVAETDMRVFIAGPAAQAAILVLPGVAEAWCATLSARLRSTLSRLGTPDHGGGEHGLA